MRIISSILLALRVNCQQKGRIIDVDCNSRLTRIMNIEGGGIGGGIGPTPAPFGAGLTFEAAPTLASLGRNLDFFGPPIGPVVPPINESPAKILGTENTVPLLIGKYNPILEISFTNEPFKGYVPIEPAISEATMPLDLNPVTEKDAVAEAESIITQAQVPLNEKDVLAGVNEVLGIKESPVEQPVVGSVTGNPRIITEAVYWFTDTPEPKVVKPAEVILPQVTPARVLQPDFWPIPDIVLSPALKAQVESYPGTENKTATFVTPTTTPQTELKKDEVEEVVEQTAQAEEEDTSETKETEISKTKIVESVKTSQERRKVIKVAVREALRLGITVKRALPNRFQELISPLVKGEKDWTVDLTADELNINPAKFSSVEKAEEVSVKSVDNNVPLEEGEGGKQATVGQVRKVIHGENDKLKSKTPAEIVKKRIVRKKIVVRKTGQNWTVIENNDKAVQENTLRELNLEEVFQKAA